MPIWRIVAVAAVLAGYACLSHALMAYWPDRSWSVAVLFGPLLAGLAAAGLARRHLPTLAGCALLTALLVLTVQAGGVGMHLLYVLQHAAIHAVLAWSFGMTLRPGATPLITLLAEHVHEHFTPEQRDYTRQLTVLWSAYFVAMIALSLLVYTAASWETWSLFCNLLTPLMAMSLFVGEHALRYRLHPEFERISMARAMRAYRAVTSPK
jgi:uncharacterized membrane protein